MVFRKKIKTHVFLSEKRTLVVMSNYMIVAFIVLGIVGGYVSGLVGVGGGIILVPALVYLFRFNQHMAQGTTLALLIPPIGILGAWAYYQKGMVDVRPLSA